MTNMEIIFNDAINNGIYTEEEATKIIEKCGGLPLHTFNEWKRRGYSIKKQAVLTGYTGERN